MIHFHLIPQYLCYLYLLRLQITMENCKQTVTMQLHCQCNETNRANNQVQREREYVDLRPIYEKFGQTLQTQLQKMSEGYVSQIDELNNQIFILKNSVQRLEIRNKKDSDAEKELRREYNILLQKLKEKASKGERQNEVQIIQKIKEVRVEVVDENLPYELSRWRQKYEQANQLYFKTKGEKDAALVEKDNLLEQLQHQKAIIQGLRKQIDTLRQREGAKDQQVQKLQSLNEYLKTNKQVVIQTKHFFPDFKPSQKVRPQTKIQTVYIQKPVEKIVVVEVERRVKQFIQPERPLVNRIISCEPKQDCKCKDMEFYGSQQREAEVQHLNDVITRLETNVKDYRNQRQKLVSVIEDKNRELNSIQTQMRLYGRGETYRGPSTVNVTVTKMEDDRPISQKISRVEADQSRATQIKKR